MTQPMFSLDSGQSPPITVAVLAGELPSPSETFIERELLALHRVGVGLLGIAVGSPARAVGTDRPSRAASLPFPVVSKVPLSEAFQRHLTAVARRPRAYVRAAALAARLAFPTFRGTRALLRVWTALPAWAWACEQAGVTHVHAHFAFVTADAAAILAQWLGLSFSVSVHAWDLYAQPDRHIRHRLRRAHWIAACTEHGRQRVATLLPRLANRVFLVRHPAPSLDPAPPAAERRRWVLAAGRLVPKKGFSLFLDACQLLVRRGISFEARLLGDGPCRAALEHRIRALGLQDIVTLEGWVPPTVVQQRMREASVLVVPSVVAPDGDRDGLPNVILEALAVSTPVVATTASAAGEVIRHGQSGFLAPPHQPERLATYMAMLLTDPQLARRIGEQGRAALMPDFHGDHIARTLVALFRRGASSDRTEGDSVHDTLHPK